MTERSRHDQRRAEITRRYRRRRARERGHERAQERAQRAQAAQREHERGTAA